MSLELGTINVGKAYHKGSGSNKAYLGSNLIFDNTEVSNNIISNGTFNNSDNITYDNQISISNGIATYTSIGTTTTIIFDIVEDMLPETDYTLTIDLLNGTNNRFRFYVNQNGSFTTVNSNTTYANGVATEIQFTSPAGENGTQFRIDISSSADSFEFDNVILTKN